MSECITHQGLRYEITDQESQHKCVEEDGTVVGPATVYQRAPEASTNTPAHRFPTLTVIIGIVVAVILCLAIVLYYRSRYK